MIQTAIKTNRRLCSTREAAQALGVTMGRVRQMLLAGTIWSAKISDKATVCDADEIERIAKQRAKARAGGHMTGPPPGGFKADRPGVRRKK